MKLEINIAQPLARHFKEACRHEYITPEKFLLDHIEGFTRKSLGDVANDALGPKEVKDAIQYDDDYLNG